MRFVCRSIALATVALLVAAVVVLDIRPTVAQAQAADGLPADLALVPADAMAFVHVRGAELWKNDLFASFRKTFERAGAKAIASLDKQFVPKPSTFDRATGFLLSNPRRPEPDAFAILSFSAPFEVAEVVAAYLPKVTAVKAEGKTYYRSDSAEFELYFPDRQNIVVGLPGTLERYLAHKSPPSGPLAAGLKVAAAGKPAVLSINVARMMDLNPRLLKDFPGVESLVAAEHLTATLELGDPKEVSIKVLAEYKNDAAAEAAETTIKEFAKLGRNLLSQFKTEIEKSLYDPKIKTPRPPLDFPFALTSVFALGAIDRIDEMLANPEKYIKRQGKELTASLALPRDIVISATTLAATGLGMVLPGLQRARVEATRLSSQNNLKQIALACHNYESAYGVFPGDILDKDGKPILSWRVAILPYIEQTNLYTQFKLDEPWDSDNNKKWSQIAIKTYMSPNAEPITPPGMTHYKGFSGPGAIFQTGKKIRIQDITDGTSNTILAVESGTPIPWAKPEDIPFDTRKPVPKLSLPGVEDLVNVAMCDGSVRQLNMKKLSDATLKAAITINGGEVLGKDWDEK